VLVGIKSGLDWNLLSDILITEEASLTQRRTRSTGIFYSSRTDYLAPIPKMAMVAEVKTFKLGDWKLQSGQTIPDAEIAYKAFGDPKSPAIIYPSWYSGGMIINSLLVPTGSLYKPCSH